MLREARSFTVYSGGRLGRGVGRGDPGGWLGGRVFFVAITVHRHGFSCSERPGEGPSQIWNFPGIEDSNEQSLDLKVNINDPILTLTF